MLAFCSEGNFAIHVSNLDVSEMGAKSKSSKSLDPCVTELHAQVAGMAKVILSPARAASAG